jgi:hypothetical protein
VTPGRFADLVVLDENPLADIRNISRIDSVVLRGQLFNRAALDKMLEGARAAALQWWACANRSFRFIWGFPIADDHREQQWGTELTINRFRWSF